MTATAAAPLSDRVHARLTRINDQLTTTGTFRRYDDELRRYVAEQFRGLDVVVADRHGRTYRGHVLAVALTTDGNVASTLVLDRGRDVWPMAISLATIDTISEVSR